MTRTPQNTPRAHAAVRAARHRGRHTHGIQRAALLILAVLMLPTALLTGCGRSDAGNGDTGAVTTASATVEPTQAASKEAASDKHGAQAAPILPPTPVEVLVLKPRDFDLNATYIGHLLPKDRVSLRSELEGVAEKIDFEEGDRVEAGQVLAHIATGRLLVQRDIARTNLKLAQANHERNVSLSAKNLVAPAALDGARNQLDMAQFNLRLSEIELAKSRITSPVSGQIKTKGAELGEYLNKGQLIAEVLDISRLRALISVPEREFRFLQVGKQMEVSLDALPTRSFMGRVTTLGLEADTASRSFPVEVELENPQQVLRPGMLARVRASLATYTRQVLLPRYAVLEREDGRVVYVARNGIAEERKIRIGASTGSEVQVLEGLAFDEQVVVTGHQRLVPNESIAVIQVVK